MSLPLIMEKKNCIFAFNGLYFQFNSYSCVKVFYTKKDTFTYVQDKKLPRSTNLQRHACVACEKFQVWVSFTILGKVSEKKNPAYGRHQLSRPMRIVGPYNFGEVASFTNPHQKTDFVHAKMRTRSTLRWGLGPCKNADSVHSGTYPRF